MSSAMFEAQLTEDGRLTVPPEVIERLHLKTGDRVQAIVSLTPNQAEVSPPDLEALLERSKREGEHRRQHWARQQIAEVGDAQMELARQQAVADGTAIEDEREAAVGD